MPRERRRRSRGRRQGSSGGGFLGTAGKVGGAPLGLAGNLFADVRDAVIGLPMGAVNLATHPGESVEAIGKSMWQTTMAGPASRWVPTVRSPSAPTR